MCVVVIVVVADAIFSAQKFQYKRDGKSCIAIITFRPDTKYFKIPGNRNIRSGLDPTQSGTKLITNNGIYAKFKFSLQLIDNVKGWFSLAHKHKHKPTNAEAVRC